MDNLVLNIIIFKNKKIDAFTTPQFIDIEPEKAALQLSRSIIMAKDDKQVEQYKNLAMYAIGTFNDSTGEIHQEEIKLLLDCNQVLKQREINNGKEVD